jgi:hypothetical protein
MSVEKVLCLEDGWNFPEHALHSAEFRPNLFAEFRGVVRDSSIFPTRNSIANLPPDPHPLYLIDW